MTTAEVTTDAGASARAALSKIAGRNSEVLAPARPALKKKADKTAPCLSPEERFQMISEAAYFKAEQRGFMAGDDLADWLAAEAEVDGLLLE
jgi:hypothetical protein